MFRLSGRDTRLDWWGVLWLLGPVVALFIALAPIAAAFAVAYGLEAFGVGDAHYGTTNRERLYGEDATTFESVVGWVATGSILAAGVAYVWIILSSHIRRLHDLDHSPWFLLVFLIPFLGGLWLFIELGCLGGDPGTNRYGVPKSGLRGEGPMRNAPQEAPPVPALSR
jgi:uncharacterized membrane protein YhaH (DUF805 family)